MDGGFICGAMSLFLCTKYVDSRYLTAVSCVERPV